ncbi:MAG: SRPBCC family protein [Deltaproteobacteria bacterium]|nr:MAG: SRPBCC family protein [Deltaproteobacteria bacterium]
MNRVEVEASYRVPPAVVWSRIADHEGLADWLPLREAVRRRRGFPDPNGVGAVRTLRGGGLVVEEEITDFKPEERLEYALLAGAPLREARGEVVLTRDGESTRVRWVVRFRPALPGTGWVVSALLARILERGLDRLRRLLEPDR